MNDDQGGAIHSFSLSCPTSDGGPVPLAVLSAALWPAGARADVPTAMIFGISCDPALPLLVVGQPLVKAALISLHAEGAERVTAVASLPGLCAWLTAEEAWLRVNPNEHGDEAAGSVEAVARGRPRPGHSVLGQGTFAKAESAFKELALEYAGTDVDADHESALLRVAGASLVGIHWLHDTSERAMRESGGVTASFEFPEVQL